MQLILRDAGHALVDPQQPARRQGLVHRYCPPSIGNLFAIARKGRTGGLEWWTELPGQPRRLDELTAAEQVALQGQLAQRLLALENLVGELERRHDPAAAELRELPTTAAPETLYSVGGEPLLIRWVPTVSAPGAVQAPKPTAIPAAASPVAKPRRRWLLPIALPLLLGGLALLGLWLALHHWDRFSLPWPQSQTPAEPVASRDAGTRPAELVSQPVDDQRSGVEPVLGTGDIQVTLRWNSADDLDLGVIDPYGDIAFFNSPITASGGQLDVDSNAGCTPSSQAPVENVFWNSDSTPEGTYVATVSLFSRCSDGSHPIPFELSITLNGNTETHTGTVNDQSPRQSFEFSFPQGS